MTIVVVEVVAVKKSQIDIGRSIVGYKKNRQYMNKVAETYPSTVENFICKSNRYKQSFFGY